jgi:hypothetical protein
MKAEEREQIALIEWAHLYDDIWPYLIHIRNEGKRSLAEGARAKRMGLMKGVSDLFFAYPIVKDEPLYRSYGVWIELKSKKGIVSAEQEAFLNKMFYQGYATGVYYSWPAAANAILGYLGKPLQKF